MYFRYIAYFHGLLSGKCKINNQQYHLNSVVIRKVPNFDGHGYCQPFIKIYQGMSLIYCSPILDLDLTYTRANDYFVFSLNPPLKLRGEILLKCYHKRSNPTGRAVIFSLQFHTGLLMDDVAIFPKEQIDIAAYDKRFHPETQVELLFNDAKLETLVQLKCLEDDQITKWNSYENFFTDEANLEYTQGPLDGSLYATVRTKRSPTQFTSSRPVSDEKKLDELLNEILLEIETFPDLTVDEIDREESGTQPLENQSSPQKQVSLCVDMANLPANSANGNSVKVAFDGDSGSGHFEESIDSVDGGQLTWLQKQQLKLKSKQEKFHVQRRNVVEKQLIAELKHTMKSQKSDQVDGAISPSLSAPTPVVPVRTSSRNIVPLFAEQSDLGQPVRTISLDHSQSTHSNGSNGSPKFHSLTHQYSALPISSPQRETFFKLSAQGSQKEDAPSSQVISPFLLAAVSH